MKKILATLALALCLIGFAGCNGGCAVGKGQLNPTTGVYDTNAMADAVVVTAESLRESALGVFDAFMRVEREHEAALKELNPDIHKAAEDIRKNGQKWLKDLTAAKVAYQTARTPDNQSQLLSSIALVRSVLISASKRLAEASTRKAP